MLLDGALGIITQAYSGLQYWICVLCDCAVILDLCVEDCNHPFSAITLLVPNITQGFCV